MPSANRSLLLLVISQFAGTSLWFAGNVVIKGIYGSNASSGIGFLSSMVQAGFISGTLIFALFTIPDRIRSSKLFFYCALAGATANLLILWVEPLWMIGFLRFTTGFFLAGIYPVGMKIAAEKFPEKLGNAMGFLVGALVLGTAFPHLLSGWGNWQAVVVLTSCFAFLGGLLVLLALPTSAVVKGQAFQPAVIAGLYRSANFRAASFGYFGHMWELYAFWAFVPLIVAAIPGNNDLLSFLTIAMGAAGCIMGGIFSRRYGSKKIAFIALLLSGLCCLLAPVFIHYYFIFYILLFTWGFSVSADSPQLTTLVARSAPPQFKGTALTITTSIGFAITIISIQLLRKFFNDDPQMLWILLPGPLVGLFYLRKFREQE